MALQTENRENTIDRWERALAELKADPPLTPPDRAYALNVVVAVDVSGSMEGARLNAVKIGLCCLLAALKSTDRVVLLTFGSAISRLTTTPKPASELLPMLPALLAGMRADGMTKYYDAVLQCLAIAGQAFPQPAGPAPLAPIPRAAPAAEAAAADVDVGAAPVAPVPVPATADDGAAAAAAVPAAAATAADAAAPDRTVVVTLTDGEDTASDASGEDVRLHLRSPGLDSLMFLAVTVDMGQGVLQMLEPWFIYSHSKRIDVTVKTGRRLVGVFAETVLLRMLRDTEESALSFFSTARGLVLREGCVEPPPGRQSHRRFSDNSSSGPAARSLSPPPDGHNTHAGGGGLFSALRGILHRRHPGAAATNVLDPTSLGATGGDDNADNDDDESGGARHNLRCSSPIFARFDSCDEDDAS